MDFDQRVQFYLGPFLSHHSEEVTDIGTMDAEKGGIKTTRDLDTDDPGSNICSLYNRPFEDLLARTGHQDRRFCFEPGDISHECSPVTMSKNRTTVSGSSVILRCLNFPRHWKLVYSPPKDCPFASKRPIVFWRGTTTGDPRSGSGRDDRFLFVRRWFRATPAADVAFSFVHRDGLKPEFQKYVAGECDPGHFLKHRYIVSLPGNDKDSGLGWKLRSNSIVFMARPRVTSWLMESELIPNHHYVLLKDDYSDLVERWIWCESHPEECASIIKCAHEFMAQFADQDREKRIEEEVIHRYFDRVR